jgi:thiol-disulfide isomerase/thioredoxin
MTNTQRGFATGTVIGLVAIIILGGAIIYGVNRSKTADTSDVMMEKENDVMMEKEGDAMMEKEDGAMIDKGGDAMTGKAGMTYSGTQLAGTKEAPLLDFVKTDYDAAAQSDALVVLYFYANWCPICKAEFPKMQEAFNELPSGTKVIGFRVNYNDSDTDAAEKALAKEFGVAYQHTKVFVKGGVKVLKAPDGWDADRYITEINKAL